MKATEQTELDFYVQYLRAHIKEHHFEKEDNTRFIRSEERRVGKECRL